MRYKVMFVQNFGNGSGLANAEFYILAEAIAAAQDWNGISANHAAYYWDGTRWNPAT